MRIRIVKGKGFKNYFIRQVSDNGNIINVSEGYATHWNAKRAARKNYKDLPKYDVNGNRFE